MVNQFKGKQEVPERKNSRKDSLQSGAELLPHREEGHKALSNKLLQDLSFEL